MIKIKPVIICAFGAFVLSFFTALAARSGFAVSSIKAAIFAMVFGGLAVGIQFLYGKFLAPGAATESVSAEMPKSVGGKVDLVVSEVDLPEDQDTPSFIVDGKHIVSGEDLGQSKASYESGLYGQASNPEKSGGITAGDRNQVFDAAENLRAKKAAENIVADSGEQKPAFVPLDLTAKDVEQSAPVSAGQNAGYSGQASVPPDQSVAGDDELDSLPDIGEEFGGKAFNSDEDIIEDSDFAQQGRPRNYRQTEMKDGSVVNVNDAPIMAEAIRTVLKKEEG